MTTVDLGYRARPAFVPFHKRRQRFAVVVAHRRAGKTVSSILDLIDAALRSTKEEPRFAYLAPYYAQAKDVVWSYLKRYTAPIPGVVTNESELRVDLPNGARIRLYGADNYDRLRGIYLDGVVLDEFADMDPRAWSEVIRPALADRQGWAVFIGTPKGRNAFWEVYERAEQSDDWFCMRLRASETGLVPQAELDAMREEMGADKYAREMETSFDAAVEGAYYAALLTEAETGTPRRITNVPHDPGVQVHAAFDLGIADSTSIWLAQFVGREVRLIDFIQNNGVGLDWYARELRSRPYTYAPLILPHDAQARELGTGKSRVEMLESLGFRTRIAPKLSVEDGIEAVRRLLPRMWIDETKCDEGLRAIRDYREKRDEKRRVSLGPLHDWCFTGDTMVLTRYGARPIKELPNQGEVLTPCGWKPYHSPRITRRNAQLVEVEFVGGHTVRCTPDHLFLTVEGWKSAESLQKGSLIRSTLTPLRSISMAASTACGRASVTCREAVAAFTEMSGRLLSALFPRAITSTIGTATSSTTRSPIWSASTGANISPSRGMSTSRTAQNTLAKRREPAPLTGIGLRKAGSGIVATPNGHRAGPSGSGKNSPADTAANSSMRWFARTLTRIGSALQNARPLRIARVERLSEREDVWCMTVPGEEAFSLANGAVVHNCSHAADALRYLAVAYEEPRVKREETRQRPRAGANSWMGM